MIARAYSSIRDRIALNVNADESAVLGAALYGASVCQSKTKDMRVTDVLMHDIQALYLASNSPTNDPHGSHDYLVGRSMAQERH
jgi:hypothetical protein